MDRDAQTLAGRTSILRLLPFSIAELLRCPAIDPRRLESSPASEAPSLERWSALWTGFYPRIHDGQLRPQPWLADYHRTYVERDLREVLRVMDTGLVCYLLGIHDAAMLERHPLRGHIFESFVVSEFQKTFESMRMEPPLFFWKDATGHEIDLLLDLGDRLHPIEVKSGVTPASDGLDELRWWSALPGNPNRDGVMVHGGTGSHRVGSFRILPW